MFKYSKEWNFGFNHIRYQKSKKEWTVSWLKVQVVYRRKQKYYSTGKEVSKRRLGKVIKGKKPVIGRNSIRYRE